MLKPGGVLLMRISNKRAVFGLVRALSSDREQRDRRMTRLLQSQFHCISARRLAQIVESIGFEKIELLPNAFSTSWSALGAFGKLSYLLAHLIYVATFKRVNLSPGVFLIAIKKRDTESVPLGGTAQEGSHAPQRGIS
jgi:hypothetical protein